MKDSGEGISRRDALTQAASMFVGAHVIDNFQTPSAPAKDAGDILVIQGDMSRVHDPVLAKDSSTYYLYSTGRGITVHTSKDMITWERAGRVFDQPIPWTATTIPGSTDFYWAPDISYVNKRWRLYYSVSTFGKNRSAIGLASNVTLDPKRPDYKWEDQGIVVESNPSDDWNAIDPNLIVDAQGGHWLAFGSFWSGIKLIRIDSASGKRESSDSAVHSIASRPRGGEVKGAIEAPYVVHRGKYYYLFASFDACCKGAASTYNVRVGRSEKITGLYVDKEGKPMLDGGGTPLLWGRDRWKGPGHNAVYREGTTEWLVYHAYDAQDRGISKLRIEKLLWTTDGWPMAPSMAGASADILKEKASQF